MTDQSAPPPVPAPDDAGGGSPAAQPANRPTARPSPPPGAEPGPSGETKPDAPPTAKPEAPPSSKPGTGGEPSPAEPRSGGAPVAVREAPPPGPGARVPWQAPPPGWPTLPPVPYRPPTPWPPPALVRRWPGPAGPAGRIVLAGAAATGVAAAIFVPLSRPGIGWLLFALVAAAVAVAVAREAGAALGPARIGWALVTVALLGAGTIRAAGWLFALCVLTAGVAAALAAAGGRSLTGLVAAVLAWPVAVLRALPWAARGLAAARGRGGGATIRTVLVTAVTAVLLLVFGSLLATADEAFAAVIGTVTPELDPASVVRWLFLLVVGTLGLLGTAFLVSAPPDLTGLERPGTRRLRRLDWMLPVLALDLLFATFVAVQFTVLFGGVSHVLGPDGPTFAEYARKGFWQLLAVTVLTLGVLGAAARWAPRETRFDRVAIRVLLGALAVFSLVIVASALYRMHVYQEAYGFTQLRLLVSVCELWLGAIFVMVLAAGVGLRAGWLPRVAVATAMAALLGLVALDPDQFIADRNIDRYAATGKIDVLYLSSLSADAVPALDRLPADLRACALAEIADDLANSPDTWNAWNLARSRARELLAERPPGTPVACYTR